MGNLDGAFTGLVIAIVIITASVCGLLFWLVPIIWGWVKPIIHSVTG